MHTNVLGLALLLSVGAIAIAGYALVQEGSTQQDLEPRLTAIEDQLARVEDALRERGAEVERVPSLMGLGLRSAGADAGAPEPRAATRGGEGARGGASAPEGADASQELAALVEAAVTKKAAQMQVMREKKPAIELFARTLELDEAQRQAAAQNVVRAQQAIQDILAIPAQDGTQFLEELVELMAHGLAQPGKDPGRGQRLFGRLLSERIPGSDETYAARVESVKSRLRETFRRDWTPKQYATFEAWHMDPTEVKGLEGSPWKAIEARVIERAKDLGAEIPAREER